MQDVLKKIINNPRLHALWLNTLSYLEFMGTRKIARSATRPWQSEMRLRHLAEEARHAHFFKMMISRVAKESLPGYEVNELFCGLSAIRYFHKLDACVKKEIIGEYKKSNEAIELCYLYVTILIEQRASGIYRIYDQLLQQSGIPIRLQGIMGEEEAHLAEMNDQLSYHNRHNPKTLDRLSSTEENLFQSFHKSMAIELIRF